MVVAGLVIPLNVIDQAPLPATYLSYSPSWVELAVVCLGFGFTGLAYLLAEKKFNLSENVEDVDIVVPAAPTNTAI